MSVSASAPLRVALLGATGTIGRATARALVEAGHTVTCVVRPSRVTTAAFPGAAMCVANVTRPASVRADLFLPGRFDREIAMTLPDDRARAQILRTMTRHMRLQAGFDFEMIARKTPGYV